MANVDWHISGVELANCNCAWGCPCQFNSLPTSGQCEAIWAMRIDKGHFGATKLDGVVWGTVLWWPGAVHEGNGKQQMFADAGTTPEQREALLQIGSGKVSNEGTYFQIFAAMAPQFLEPVWAPVSFELDLERRVGKLAVQGLAEVTVEPIRNPVTGDEHRARVTLPTGFEYREAEYASGSAKTKGGIRLDHSGRHAHLARVGFTPAGIA
jgi:hypothetical protein